MIKLVFSFLLLPEIESNARQISVYPGIRGHTASPVAPASCFSVGNFHLPHFCSWYSVFTECRIQTGWGCSLVGRQRPSDSLWAESLGTQILLRCHLGISTVVSALPTRHQAIRFSWRGVPWKSNKYTALWDFQECFWDFPFLTFQAEPGPGAST